MPPVARVPQAPRACWALPTCAAPCCRSPACAACSDGEAGDVAGRARRSSSTRQRRSRWRSMPWSAGHGRGRAGSRPRQAELAAEPGERLQGAFETGPGGCAKILDMRALLSARSCNAAPGASRAAATSGRASPHADAEAAAEPANAGHVRRRRPGICARRSTPCRRSCPTPETLAAVPRADAVVLGVIAYRDSLLPLLSLRGLLGFAPAAQASGREKVIVTTRRRRPGRPRRRPDARHRFGRPEPGRAEPSVLAARTGGEARIKAIYRGEAADG